MNHSNSAVVTRLIYAHKLVVGHSCVIQKGKEKFRAMVTAKIEGKPIFLLTILNRKSDVFETNNSAEWFSYHDGNGRFKLSFVNPDGLIWARHDSWQYDVLDEEIVGG